MWGGAGELDKAEKARLAAFHDCAKAAKPEELLSAVQPKHFGDDGAATTAQRVGGKDGGDGVLGRRITTVQRGPSYLARAQAGKVAAAELAEVGHGSDAAVRNSTEP